MSLVVIRVIELPRFMHVWQYVCLLIEKARLVALAFDFVVTMTDCNK